MGMGMLVLRMTREGLRACPPDVCTCPPQGSAVGSPHHRQPAAGLVNERRAWAKCARECRRDVSLCRRARRLELSSRECGATGLDGSTCTCNRMLLLEFASYYKCVATTKVEGTLRG